MKTYADTLQELDDISHLEANWNGNGAEPLNQNIRYKTETVLKDLPIQPRIFPLTDGGLQLEFHGDRSYVELDVSKPETAGLFVAQDNTAKYSAMIPFTADAVKEVLKKYYC